MKTIKTKPTKKEPRVLSKMARLPKAMMRKAAIESREKMRDVADNKQEQRESPQQYATDEVTHKAEHSIRKAGQSTKNGAKRLMQKIRQTQKIKTGGAENRSSFLSADKSPVSNTPKMNIKAEKADIQIVRKTASSSKNIVANAKNASAVKRPVRTVRTVRNAASNTTKTVKSTPKGIVKTTKKTIKGTKTAIKAGTRAIKTTAQTTKAAARTAQAAARAAKVALQAAKAAAKAAATAIKLTVKAIIAGIKIAIAAMKALIAAIAAGGGVVILVIVIIAVIVMVVGTLFGVFFADEAQEGEPLKTAIVEINTEFETDVQRQIDAITNTVAHDATKVVYTGGMDGDSDTVNNWSDVLAIYTVQTMYNGDETMSFTPEKIENLRSIFKDMNNYTVSYEVRTEEVEDAETPEEVTEAVTLVIFIEVQSITAEECASKYNFNEEQLALLKELLSPTYSSYFAEIIGIDIYGGTLPGDLKDIVSNLPPNERGTIIVQAALARLGDPYSQPERGKGRYIDCSWLTYIAYQAAGISIPTTSVEQAQYCYDNNLMIGLSELQPGDLIFWAKTTCECGRFHEIHHVAIYMGNNKIIEASSSKGRVVVSELWGLNGGKWQVWGAGRVA